MTRVQAARLAARTFAWLSIGASAPVFIASCGFAADIDSYCQQTLAVAAALGVTGDFDSCVERVDEDLAALVDEQRAEAEECISCIADSETTECGCCTTSGELDVLRDGETCKSRCDTAGLRAFCGQ